MINNLTSDLLNTINQTHNEEDYLTNSTLELLAPYFNADLNRTTLNQRFQWFYNLFKISRHVDLGLGHAIHHTDIARMYASYCQDETLYNKIFNVPYSCAIGATTDSKPSSTVTFKKHNDGWLINGTFNWITNALSADYLVTVVNDPEENKDYRILIDLDACPHVREDPNTFPELTGMIYARPSSITFDNQLLPNTCILGSISWPMWDPGMFECRKTANLAFLTNLTANSVALMDEVESFAALEGRLFDMTVLKVKNDVMMAVDSWIQSILQSDSLDNNEIYWQRQRQTYMFAKHTLLKVINLSREFSMQSHLYAGKSSRVYRNSVTFSSHMTKLYKLTNDWGDESNVFNSDRYIHHIMNRYINGVSIPADINNKESISEW